MLNNDAIISKEIDTPLGAMLAGTSENGICFLEWHDEDRGGVERIRHTVSKRYGSVPEPGSHAHLERLQQELALYFAGKLQVFTVPIAVKGTRFEMATWERLLAIPYGQTRSYSQIARELDNPAAVRAVGRANGANWVSIVIPCHRVIRADGSLGGYGGKLWRKQRLLDLESQTHRL